MSTHDGFQARILFLQGKQAALTEIRLSQRQCPNKPTRTHRTPASPPAALSFLRHALAWILIPP